MGDPAGELAEDLQALALLELGLQVLLVALGFGAFGVHLHL